MGALANYQSQVQDLLHDPIGQMWPVASLPAYINEARNRVAQDTKCLRQVVANSNFPALQFAQGQEFFNPQTFLPAGIGNVLVDVLGITVIINQQRLKLIPKAYTWMDANFRGWVNYTQWPQYFARVSPTQICIAPVPNIAYACDWDVAINPNPLIDDTTVDVIPIPFQEPVQYYACYKAKLKQQSQGEAQFFLSQYMQNLRWCARAYMHHQADPYGASG